VGMDCPAFQSCPLSHLHQQRKCLHSLRGGRPRRGSIHTLRTLRTAGGSQWRSGRCQREQRQRRRRVQGAGGRAAASARRRGDGRGTRGDPRHGAPVPAASNGGSRLGDRGVEALPER
jgi:hypothetical protein